MNKDLRSFLAEVERLGPKFFVRVERQVDFNYEPCVIQQKLAALSRYPVLRFDRVKGSSIPLVTNLFGNYEMLGLALGIPPGEPKRNILDTFRRRLAAPIPTTMVSRSQAPVKEVVQTGADVDLGRLPILKHAELNGGKYITVGFLVVRDPETGILNAGVYRHEIKNRNSFACMFNPAHHAGYIYRRYNELRRPMEAALILGHHPAVVMGSLARGAMESNELELMGALLGESLEVVAAETVDLPVPASAEIVIEGILDPGRETSDGPFSEYTGFYGPAKDPVGLMQVSAITMRRNAIYHDLDPSHREHNLAGVLSFEASVFESVKKLVPSVRGVYMPPSGSCVFTAYVQIKKRVPGEGKSAGLAAIAAEPNLKIAVVVDDDVDIYDEEQILWAIATQCEADRDLTIIPNAMGAHLNPSAYGERRHEKGPMNTKMVIDATRPVTMPFAERIRPPKEAWERIRLEDYIPGG
jgi:2,5-furandicarboxylate decarboxylase 1